MLLLMFLLMLMVTMMMVITYFRRMLPPIIKMFVIAGVRPLTVIAIIIVIISVTLWPEVKREVTTARADLTLNFWCKSAHHRSVAMVEMVRNVLYRKAGVVT